jgi:serine/threonine protein kinase
MAVSDSLVGTVVDGKYCLEALLGAGGMGAVYRATQLQLERPVAVKIIRGEFLSDPAAVERFRREALVIARLNHPNIVTIHDFGIAPDVERSSSKGGLPWRSK